MTRRNRWLRTDEREDAVHSLEWTRDIALRIELQPHAWKWLLIALHNTAQGYMVVALEKGNGLLALRPKVAQKWLKAYAGDGPYPIEKLDDFLPLYSKIKNGNYFHQPFNATASHDRSIEHLNTFRGYFTHFTPKGWSLELAGLPRLVIHTTDLIEWAAFRSDALWHKASQLSRTKRALTNLRRLMKRCEV